MTLDTSSSRFPTARHDPAPGEGKLACQEQLFTNPAQCSASFSHGLPGADRSAPPPANEIDRSAFSYARLGDTCCYVRPLEENEIGPAVALLQQRMEPWGVADTPIGNPAAEHDPFEPEPSVEVVALDEEQLLWNTRVDNAWHIAGCIGVSGYSTVFCAFLDDQPIGLLEVQETGDDHLHISHFVTHPGSRGAGWQLMAQALQQSQSCGCEGRVHLHSASASASDAYLAMGFVHEPLLGMVLDPTLPGKPWQISDHGEWSRRPAAQPVRSDMNRLNRRHSAPADTGFQSSQQSPREPRSR